MNNILILLCLVSLGGGYRHVKDIHINRPPTDVRDDVATYYAKKYPVNEEIDNNAFSFDDGDTRPISEMVSSNPCAPLYTFFEATEKSTTEVTITKLDFYSENDSKSCKIVISAATLDKAESMTYSNISPMVYSSVPPITEHDILNLSKPESKEVPKLFFGKWRRMLICKLWHRKFKGRIQSGGGGIAGQ
jgi:hypothetical protein